MFSSLVSRAGVFGSLIKPQGTQRVLAVVQKRCAAGSSAEQLQKWESADQIFYGPERDLKNFPHPVQPETTPPVRLGFLPESWFQLFYNKTGVTGPYIFVTGLTLTALSKEIWVVDHGFSEVIGFWGSFLFITSKVGPRIAKHLDDMSDRIEHETYLKPLSDGKKNYEDKVVECEKNIWREDGQKYIFEAKKENIDLQLEAIYRKRIQEVYQEVKRRLDYQLNLQTTKRRFEQDHMVNWIVNGVVGSITPQQEKESINKCISDLREMAAA